MLTLTLALALRLKTMEDTAYDKMKQLLKWNDKNLRKKILSKEDSYGPRGEQGPPGHNGKDGKDGEQAADAGGRRGQCG